MRYASLNVRGDSPPALQELDKKKNEALQKTHAQVNRDFGSIFSTLLPGACAKLDPPAGMTVLDGLEVRVGFGNTWKESLTELSGGQRSLIALSLILSLLLFKPAPMYILDEIDAALDLSHTQNIGKMLRTHFSQSQFIVVSLKVCLSRDLRCSKPSLLARSFSVLVRLRYVHWANTLHFTQEGMFNNANVLYRVRFVDGTSTVTRYEPLRDGENQPAQPTSKAATQRAPAAPKPFASRNRS